MVQKKEFNKLPKNNFKLIALDVDGTLINSDHIVTPRTLRAIKKAKDLGIKVTIATGRHFPSVIRLARKIQINAPLICGDGAIIRDIYSNDTMFHLLPQEIAVDILRMTQNYKNFTVQVFIKNGKIYAGQSYRGNYLKNFLRAPLKHSLKGYFNLLRDFVFIPVQNTGNTQGAIDALNESPAKVVVYGNERPEDLKDFINKVLDKYGDSITITSSIKNCIDILKGGISKAKGLIILTEKLGIRRDEIITVGDNFNDLEMIKYAGLGVAMGNAPEQVKNKADYVTDTNDNEGLAKFLENLISVKAKTEQLPCHSDRRTSSVAYKTMQKSQVDVSQKPM